MSTLWTPDGERPVPRAGEPAASPPPSGGAPGRPGAGDPGGAPVPGGSEVEPDEEELRARMAELQQQMADTPAEVVVANHAYGLFELGALHLSLEPPQLEQAKTAIDALSALVEGMAGRLGDHEKDLTDGLAQLRMAFVQVRAAHGGPQDGASAG